VETIKLAAQVHLPGTADSVCRAAARAVFPRTVSLSGPNLLQRRMKTIANLIVRQFLHVRFAATEIIAIVSSQPVKYIPILAFRRGIFAAVGTLSRRVIVSAI
jgi:hypothetical protein